MSLKDMPMATIEQQAEFRRAAIELERQLLDKINYLYTEMHNREVRIKKLYKRINIYGGDC